MIMLVTLPLFAYCGINTFKNFDEGEPLLGVFGLAMLLLLFILSVDALADGWAIIQTL